MDMTRIGRQKTKSTSVKELRVPAASDPTTPTSRDDTLSLPGTLLRCSLCTAVRLLNAPTQATTKHAEYNTRQQKRNKDVHKGAQGAAVARTLKHSQAEVVGVIGFKLTSNKQFNISLARSSLLLFLTHSLTHNATACVRLLLFPHGEVSLSTVTISSNDGRDGGSDCQH